MPEISIIVPVYKVEAYLDRCINSILNQTFKDFELILVDDGSPDRCPQLCDEWAKKDERIKVIHKENGGLSSARNAGLKIALGNFIGFVDSDDWIASDMYEYLLDIISKSNADIAMCGYTRKDSELDEIEIKGQIKVLTNDDLWRFFYRVDGEESNYAVWTRLYKIETLRNVSFLEGKINEDVLFTYDVYKNIKKLVVSNAKKYFYYSNASGITKSKLSNKDLALLDIWDEIVSREHNYVNWAKLNRMRATYTLYTKNFLYGHTDSISKKELKNWKKELIQNFSQLTNNRFLDWKRKIILILEIMFPIR